MPKRLRKSTYCPLHVCANSKSVVCSCLLWASSHSSDVSAVKSEAESTTYGTQSKQIITGKLNEFRPVDEYLKDNQSFNIFCCGWGAKVTVVGNAKLSV